MVMYELTEQVVVSEAVGSYISYGLQTQGECIEDISSVREKVEALAGRLNACELSPLHLRDAVDDWLAQQ